MRDWKASCRFSYNFSCFLTHFSWLFYIMEQVDTAPYHLGSERLWLNRILILVGRGLKGVLQWGSIGNRADQVLYGGRREGWFAKGE
jgi:hypothetical protein